MSLRSWYYLRLHASPLASLAFTPALSKLLARLCWPAPHELAGSTIVILHVSSSAVSAIYASSLLFIRRYLGPSILPVGHPFVRFITNPSSCHNQRRMRVGNSYAHANDIVKEVPGCQRRLINGIRILAIKSPSAITRCLHLHLPISCPSMTPPSYTSAGPHPLRAPSLCCKLIP